MPKKTLVDGKILDRILSLYPELSPDRKDKFMASVRNTNPTLAKAFNDWEGSFIDLLKAVKKLKEKNNQDTKQIDALISRVKSN
jgi:hypothetical protein